MSTDTVRGQGAIVAKRRTTEQLLAAAERDTDAVSIFNDGTDWNDTERAIFVVKGREHIAYLRALLTRQGLLTDGKSVEGDTA
jgi:hypothetical protein